MNRHVLGAAGVALASLLVAGCLGNSPRPETTSTAPPVPVDTIPLGPISWTQVALPIGRDPESTLSDAAGGPAGFVIVGDTGALAFQGVVLRSPDGHTWQVIHDPDVVAWGLSKVIATDAGFLAIGGRFSKIQSDGSTSWASAVLTSRDGSDWSVRQTFEGVDILSVAARGPVVVATTDAGALLESRDTGATWRRIEARSVGTGNGLPTAVAVLGSGRWVAVGTHGASAAAWSSRDAITWSTASIDGADPVPGIKSVSPTAIAAGSSVAVASGVDDPTDCAEGDDFCGHYGAGWTTTEGDHWARLPRHTPLTEGTGGFIWSAGSAGVVSTLPNLAQSANGWTWTAVAGKQVDLPFGGFVIYRGSVIAAGIEVASDTPKLGIWLGSIEGQ